MPTAPILIIAGPTASGKSGLAIEIARARNGEILSVDSRQIYRGMDIGTGKVTFEEQSLAKHHLIDIRHPNEDYNVTDFVTDAKEFIADIQSRGKLPILCGGTGFWMQAISDNQTFPSVLPNPSLRVNLSKLSAEELFAQIKQLDPNRAETIDRNNPVRLIRALEIIEALGKVPPLSFKFETKGSDHKPELTDSKNNFIITALNPSKEILDAKIKKRLDERFDQGMTSEIRTLRDQGISWERLETFGLEYRWIARFLQGNIEEKAMRERLFFDIVHYAKRQKTWLRRWEKQGTKIHWIMDPKDGVAIIESLLK